MAATDGIMVFSMPGANPRPRRACGQDGMAMRQAASTLIADWR
jgi:hypothetical protein